MMRFVFCILLCGVTQLWMPSATGGQIFQLGAPFQDGAVLQRDAPIAVWGRAPAGDEIAVEFAGQSKAATADAEGRWKVMLEPVPANARGTGLRATSSREGRSLTVSDILVGDVWLCSGQSNMLWPLRSTTLAREEIAAADYPLIRVFTIRGAASSEPSFELDGRWTRAEPHDDPERAPTRNFSGVAWHFAKAMQAATGVPTGIIQPAFGGSIIESWLPSGGVQSVTLAPVLKQRWQDWESQIDEAVAKWEKELKQWEAAAAEAKKTGAKISRAPKDPRGLHFERNRPSSLYHAMVAPLVPYTLKGILWYQGESNAGRHAEYAELFRALIRSWRSEFQQGDLPFLFVQLPNFQPAERHDPTGESWAWLREAQAQAQSEPETRMAVILDLGEADDVHPRNKKDVGERLALLAQEILGNREIEAQGPRFSTAKQDGDAMLLTFEGNTPLVLREGSNSAFTLAGEDRVFHPASAVKVKDSELRVSSPHVSSPVAVRYAWKNNPPALLFGTNGLPVAPFRSDDWEAPASQSAAAGSQELED